MITSLTKSFPNLHIINGLRMTMTNTNSHRQIHQRPLNQPFIKPFPMHWQPLLISCYEAVAWL